MADENPYQNFVKFVQDELAHGRSVVIGDNEHMSALPRQIMDSKALMAAVAQSGGTAIMEGPKVLNRLVADFYNGKISEEKFRKLFSGEYQSNNVAKAQEYNRDLSDIFVHAKAERARIFYPETNTAYDNFAKDPEGLRAFVKVAGELTSLRCAPVQWGPIMNALTADEKQAYDRFDSMLTQRTSSEENKKIVEGITGQPGPYLVLYGDGHRDMIASGLKATTVGIMASENVGYQGISSTLPEYVYYADTDHLIHIPEGSQERAAFITRHVGKSETFNNQTLATGKPLTFTEARACIAALPTDVREAKPPPATPGNSSSDWLISPAR